jgi:hypothetical protein
MTTKITVSLPDHLVVAARAAVRDGLGGVVHGRAGSSEVVDASVVVCARERRHTVVTSDAEDLRRIDPHLPIVAI